jgi:hypothetical protein
MAHDLKDQSSYPDSERIKDVVTGLLPDERALHDQAILEGQKDVACFVCHKVFLAHRSIMGCHRDEDTCPFKMSEIDRRNLRVRLEKRDNEPSLPLFTQTNQ